MLDHVLLTLVRKGDGRGLQLLATTMDRQIVHSDLHGGEISDDAVKRTKGFRPLLAVKTLCMLLP
jgi:hypothetical protein